MNTNAMISAGRIAASTAAWATSPAVMALTESEWGVLAGLHFAGDDVLLADLSPRVVDAYLSDPDVTQPPAKMPRLMLRVTRCADPAAWYAYTHRFGGKLRTRQSDRLEVVGSAE